VTTDPVEARLRAALREGPGSSAVDLPTLRTATRSRIRRGRRRRSAAAAGLVILVVLVLHSSLDRGPYAAGPPAGRVPTGTPTSVSTDRSPPIGAPGPSGLDRARIGEITDDPGTRLSLIESSSPGPGVATVPGQTCARSGSSPRPVTGGRWTFLLHGGLDGSKYEVIHDVTRWPPGAARSSFGPETRGVGGGCRWKDVLDIVPREVARRVFGRGAPQVADAWAAATRTRDGADHEITVTRVAVRVGDYIVSTQLRPLGATPTGPAQLDRTGKLAVTAALRLGGSD
jgi:hypothetical protein